MVGVVTNELTLTIPAEWWLTSNQRIHWSKRSTATANLRTLAIAECQKQRVIRGLQFARIVAHLTYPDKRQRDAQNAHLTTKALVDGLIDYGVLPDDNDAHLVGPDHRNAGVTPGKYTVRLVIESGDTSEGDGRNAVR